MMNNISRDAKVTIAIPTYNRADLLREALESALSQDYEPLRIVVFDNASRDATAAVVRSFTDPRVEYRRNECNIGHAGNVNRAIVENTSPYLTILFDDDLLLPGFVRESAAFLDTHPSVGISFTLARYIDAQGTPMELADVDLPPGVTNGLQYLDLGSVKRRGGSISSVMMRASAIPEAGLIDSPHTKHTLDVNFYYRAARHFDVGFIPKELAHIRLHPDQHSEREWSSERLGYNAEYIDAIALLLMSDRADDQSYRAGLARRLMTLNRRQSEALQTRVPNLHWTWEELTEMTKRELAEVLPSGATFVLVDENTFGADLVPGRHPIPFIERDGQYWGPPADGATAVHELERLRGAGAAFAVFAWPAFWWLDHYTELDRYLRSQCRCVLNNNRLIVFSLPHGAAVN